MAHRPICEMCNRPLDVEAAFGPAPGAVDEARDIRCPGCNAAYTVRRALDGFSAVRVLRPGEDQGIGGSDEGNDAG